MSLVVVLVAAVAGCSRTDDGTVIIPPALDARRMDFGPFDLRHPGHIKPVVTAPNIVAAAPEPFPIAPGITDRHIRRSVKRPGKSRSNRNVQQAPASAAAPPQLACEASTPAGKRVRVLCE
jgi:hypothetical protein